MIRTAVITQPGVRNFFHQAELAGCAELFVLLAVVLTNTYCT